MKIETLSVGPMQANCYILIDEVSREALIIDPGADYKRIKHLLDRALARANFIVNTHGHIDHIGADDQFSLPIYIHRDDVSLLCNPKLNLSEFLSSPFQINTQIHSLEDNEDICLGSRIHLKVIHTPGHTPGSICLLSASSKEKIIFTGDTLFFEGIGRTDFAGASSELLLTSIKKKIFILPEDTVIYPGHGPGSTIGHEKKNNPFLINA